MINIRRAYKTTENVFTTLSEYVYELKPMTTILYEKNFVDFIPTIQ